MKLFYISILFVFFLSIKVYSDDITVIELHTSSGEGVTQDNNIKNEELEAIENKELDTEINKESSSVSVNNDCKIEFNKNEDANQEIISNEESDAQTNIENLLENELFNNECQTKANESENSNQEIVSNEENEDNDDTKNVNSNENNNIETDLVSEENSLIISASDYWEESTKEDLEFLFKNIDTLSSKVLANYFVDILSGFSNVPKLYTQAEFDNLRIKTLVKMGHKEKALRILNDINTYETYKDYYNKLKLDHYLAIDDLPEACNFKDSLQESLESKNNNILKISIFCEFIQNNYEEADFLNSLLIDSKDKDEYFQKIYFNLKNNINDSVNINNEFFDESSFALYTAMLRIGNFPFNEKFLDYDPINLSLPIVQSSYTDISLRLKAAHKAYNLELFNADRLVRLYRRVRFTPEELDNSLKFIDNYKLKPEIGMALLFQFAEEQPLPITVVESLKEFWNYAIENKLEKLAYDVSRNLIETMNISKELSEYSLLLARAHIFNKNFEHANKWINFAENFNEPNNEIIYKNLNNVKFLYDLHKSEDNNIFKEALEKNLIEKIEKEGTVSGYGELLKTIYSSILNQKELINKIEDEKKVYDERVMPSKYIIDKIINSSENNMIGELMLSTLVSLKGKSWNDVHPQHLKILLDSFSNPKLSNLTKEKINKLFKDIIIEILEERKII